MLPCPAHTSGAVGSTRWPRAVIVAALVLSAPGPARAEPAPAPRPGDEAVTGAEPPMEACIALLMLDATPAVAEGVLWATLGGGLVQRDDGWEDTPLFGVGAEVALALARLSDGRHYGGAFLLRWGTWLAGFNAGEGGLFEGGLHLSFGQASHAQWGTFTLRAGAGYGDGLGPAAGHLSLTLTGGVHSFLGRYSERGACDSKPKPAPFGMGNVARLFATARVSLDGSHIVQWTFGLELSPGYLAPPYSALRWAGGRP